MKCYSCKNEAVAGKTRCEKHLSSNRQAQHARRVKPEVAQQHRDSNMKSWFKYHEKNKAKWRDRYQANAEQYAAEAKQRRSLEPGREAVKKLRNLYGFSVETAQIVLHEIKHGNCHICGRSAADSILKQGRAGLHVDHNHTTGKVRGLLCSHCNVGLGCYRDSTDLLSKAILYLQTRDG